MQSLMKRLSVSFVCLLLLVACATKTQTLVVTGETLDAVGKQFVTTGQLYDQLLATNKITGDDYRVWANFAKTFKVVYPQAVQAWKTGKSTDDTLQLLLNLKSQLLQFYLYASTTAKGGTQ